MTFKEFASRINVNVDNAPDDCDMSLEITVENCIDIINMLGSQIRHLQEREIRGKQGKVSPDWHTGNPTETGLYVVLTEVVTIGIHSSKGTYILDWWDGYCFKNLQGIVQNSPIHRIKEYSWVKWQKIEEEKEKDNG